MSDVDRRNPCRAAAAYPALVVGLRTSADVNSRLNVLFLPLNQVPISTLVVLLPHGALRSSSYFWPTSNSFLSGHRRAGTPGAPGQTSHDLASLGKGMTSVDRLNSATTRRSTVGPAYFSLALPQRCTTRTSLGAFCCMSNKSACNTSRRTAVARRRTSCRSTLDNLNVPPLAACIGDGDVYHSRPHACTLLRNKDFFR